MQRRMLTALALAVTTAAGGLAATPAADAAAPIVVTTTRDVVNAGDGLMSLREAISRANARAGSDTLQLAAGATYRITICRAGEENANASGDFDSTDAAGIKITGNGAVIENTCADQRVLTTRGEATLEWTTVRRGHAQGEGGAIHAEDLTLAHTTVESSDATASGGGIRATGILLLLEGSRVRSNRSGAWGGGAAVDGLIYMFRSRVESNTAGIAGGISGLDGVMLVEAAVTSNVGTGDVGGIFSTSGVIASVSTVAGNRGIWVGGISNNAGGTLLSFATVVDNPATQAGTSNIATDALDSFGSIIALPSGPAGTVSCQAGNVSSDGYNFDGDGTCRLRAATDRIRGGDPRLGVLLGGYRVPNVGSPVLDRIPVNDARCTGMDQRGLQRPRGAGCDIGAIER